MYIILPCCIEYIFTTNTVLLALTNTCIINTDMNLKCHQDEMSLHVLVISSLRKIMEEKEEKDLPLPSIR